MALTLTPEQIDRLIQQADGLAPKEGSIFRALVKLTEAAVRKEGDALIQLLVEALRGDRIDIEDWPTDSRIALDALCARLESKP